MAIWPHSPGGYSLLHVAGPVPGRAGFHKNSAVAARGLFGCHCLWRHMSCSHEKIWSSPMVKAWTGRSAIFFFDTSEGIPRVHLNYPWTFLSLDLFRFSTFSPRVSCIHFLHQGDSGCQNPVGFDYPNQIYPNLSNASGIVTIPYWYGWLYIYT